MVMRATRKDERSEEFWNGIPNKDLSEEEYRALTNEQREIVRTSGLWDVLTDREYEDQSRPRAASRAVATNSVTETKATPAGAGEKDGE